MQFATVRQVGMTRLPENGVIGNYDLHSTLTFR